MSQIRFLSRRRTIVFWLRCLAVACILPAWAATALLIVRSYDRERATFEAGTVGTARALVQAIDRDLASAEAGLQMLATSPSLASGDLAGFYDQARAALGSEAGLNIVLVGPRGEQLINTLKPFGAPLPQQGYPDVVRRVFATGMPVVSDLQMSAVTGQPLVIIEVPVPVQGTVRYGLGMGISLDRVGEILRGQNLPPDWVAAIFDSKGTIVARTHTPEQFIGKKGAPALLQRMAEIPEGVIESSTLEGIPVLGSFSRSTVSGWAIAIGIPTEVLTADLRRSLWLSAGGVGLLLLLGAFLSQIISRRIVGSIRALSASAMALASEAPMPVASAQIEEVDEVVQTMAKAAQLLRRRALEREHAQEAERRMAAAKEAAEDAGRAERRQREAEQAMHHTQRLEALGRLAGGIAHDLNNTLVPVLALAKTSMRGLPEGDRVHQNLALIHRAGERARDLVDQVLAFSREETLPKQPVVLSAVVGAALALLRASIPATIRIEERIAAAPVVFANVGQLHQVLTNLVTNAAHAIGAKIGTIGIEVALDGDPGDGDDANTPMARLSVTDSGAGMNETTLQHLFEPFYTTKAVGEGSGLGLAVVHGIVADHGGRIEVASRPGGGARFDIFLPTFGSDAPVARGTAALV